MSTNKIIYDSIDQLLSLPKIKPYKQKYCDQWFYFYKNDLSQAKEIFISLHFLEIFLRNKINTEFKHIFGNWLSADDKTILRINEYNKILKVLSLLNKSKKNINSHDIISNLSFGFWTNLFHQSYNYRIWQQNDMTKNVFPFLKNFERDIKKIHNDMKKIRILRNRIFHFENLYKTNLSNALNEINFYIYGVSGLHLQEFLN